jgi:hypothetical protein
MGRYGLGAAVLSAEICPCWQLGHKRSPRVLQVPFDVQVLLPEHPRIAVNPYSQNRQKVIRFVDASATAFQNRILLLTRFEIKDYSSRRSYFHCKVNMKAINNGV